MELQHPLDGEEAIAQAPVDLSSSGSTQTIQLWDAPLRIFHWALVASVSVAIVSGKIGGDWMAVHSKAGITTVGLLVFRVIWGFVGSTHARFSSFVPTPHAIWLYLKGLWFGVGHNPLGALSVIALLTVLGFQAGSGLFSNDDIAFSGPLISLVQEATSQKLTAWHHLVANGLLVLLGVHVLAIVFYFIFKKTNLVRPMVTGQKAVPQHVSHPQRFSWGGLVLALSLAVAAIWLVSGQWIRSEPPTPAAAEPVQPVANAASASPGW